MKADKLERRVQRAEENEVDLAFDTTIVRQCDHKGCEARGTDRPVLLLQPGRDYTGKPMRMPLGIVVCEAHKEKTPDAYLTDEMWNDILSGFKSRGVATPHRTSTRLDFTPQGPPKQDA
jgi:hypothetical protein